MPRRLALLALLAPSLLSCGKPEVAISIKDGGNDLRGLASWVEFDIFQGQCPDEEQLITDTFDAPFKRQVVSVEEELTAPGDLSAETYGFAVLLRRQDDCGIIGFGCVKADLAKVRSISIKVNPVDPDENDEPQPRSRCEAPAACVEGQCIEEGGGEGGSGGGGGGDSFEVPVVEDFACKQAPAGDCSLRLIGSGALPAPLEGAVVGGPSVVATGDGFMVGYHEMTPGGEARLVRLLRVGNDGCNGAMSQAVFSQSAGIAECEGKAEATEPTMGGAWNPTLGEGLFGFSRSPCPEQGRGSGMGLVRFDSEGLIAGTKSEPGYNATDNTNPDVPSLLFSSQYSISRGVDGETFRVIYVLTGDAQTFALNGTRPGDPLNYEAPFGSVDGAALKAQTGVMVSDDSFWAQAASGTLGGNATTLLRIAKGGSSKIVKRPAATDLALRLVGADRVLLASRTPGVADPSKNDVSWALMASDGSQVYPATADSNEVLGPSNFGFDVAVTKKKAVFVMGKGSAIQLTPINNLDATPSAGAAKSLTSNDIPALAGFSGKLIAAAATVNRVAVAWITGTSGSAGGVAVFECE